RLCVRARVCVCARARVCVCVCLCVCACVCVCEREREIRFVWVVVGERREGEVDRGMESAQEVKVQVEDREQRPRPCTLSLPVHPSCLYSAQRKSHPAPAQPATGQTHVHTV